MDLELLDANPFQAGKVPAALRAPSPPTVCNTANTALEFSLLTLSAQKVEDESIEPPDLDLPVDVDESPSKHRRLKRHKDLQQQILANAQKAKGLTVAVGAITVAVRSLS